MSQIPGRDPSLSNRGRPLKEGSLTDEELHKIGKELVDWVEDTEKRMKENVFHLSSFYQHLKGFSRTQWLLIIDRTIFKPYYEKALLACGRMLVLNKNIAQSYGNRFLPIYFAEIREYENELRKNKAEFSAIEILNAIHRIETNAKSVTETTGESEVAS